jgi:transposase InsO family protein
MPLTNYQAGAPMERVHLDFLGPLPKTTRGNEYVLMMVDQFTKWVECVPLPSQTAEATAQAAVQEFFTRFGCPLQIHTDQGRNFESQLFKAVCELFQIHKSRTTPYRPSANGQVERFNRTLMNAVRCYVSTKNEWDQFLPLLAGAMRSCVNRQTGFTANMLMLGRETHQPMDLLFPDPEQKAKHDGVEEYVQALKENTIQTHEIARQNLKTAQKTMKRDYDVKVLVRTYKVGDPVYLLDTATTKGTSSKLKAPWKGPGIICEKITDMLFRVLVRDKEFTVNHDRIKLCRDKDLPTWIKRYQRNPESLKAKASKSQGEELYCLCRRPDSGGFMIQCDLCLEWFHGPCVNVTPAVARRTSKYVCPNCQGDPVNKSDN